MDVNYIYLVYPYLQHDRYIYSRYYKKMCHLCVSQVFFCLRDASPMLSYKIMTQKANWSI